MLISCPFCWRSVRILARPTCPMPSDLVRKLMFLALLFVTAVARLRFLSAFLPWSRVCEIGDGLVFIGECLYYEVDDLAHRGHTAKERPRNEREITSGARVNHRDERLLPSAGPGR